MALAGRSQQAIQKALGSKRINGELVPTLDGPNAGRDEWQVFLDDAFFRAYPHARQAWEIDQATDEAAAILHAEKDERLAREEAARNARAEALRNVVQGRSSREEDLAAARAWLVTGMLAFQEERGIGIKAARYEFAKALQEGLVERPLWVEEAYPKVSDTSLYRWETEYRKGGVEALEPRYRNGSVPEMDRHPEVGEYAIGLMLKAPDVSAIRLHEMVQAKFGARVPGVSSFQRYLKDWKQANQEQFQLAMNPDKYRSKYMPAVGSLSEDVKALNDLWEADATPVDLIFVGDRKRYMLCCLVDVYSDRRMWRLVEHAGARDQVLLLMDAINAWGLPARLKTDNGKDYTAKDVDSALLRLGIEHKLCPPFRGDRKPHVERGFRTFLHDLVPALPGFCGHNVAQAQDIRARQSFADRLFKRSKDNMDPLETGVTREEFEAFLTTWQRADELRVRGDKSHIEGKSPRQRVDEWAADPLNHVRRIDPTILAYLLLPSLEKTVQKKGIQHLGRWFAAPSVAVGLRVEIRETDDVGRLLVFQGERFLALAECADITGISKEDLAVQSLIHHQSRTKKLRESTKALTKGIDVRDAITTALHARMEGSDPVQNLQHVEMVQTQSLIEATRALQADLEAQARTLKPLLEKRELGLSDEQVARVKAELNRKPEEDSVDRYVRLRRLPMVSQEDRDWMDRFETTPRGIGALKLIPYPQPKAQ